ncbi:MAG: ribonuclease D [Coriobacteriales bacterium]|jgi:ribonuclease D|nr:ribonuclease D [Coriobacteriales bacterium]
MQTPPRYLKTEADLIQYCAELQDFAARSADAPTVLAVDTEFVREKTYYAQLCLVQLATDQQVTLVDPLALSDLSPLADLMADPHIVKVFHAGSQDLEICWQLFKHLPAPFFDTQVAAALDGGQFQMGLAKLVDKYADVRLAKGESLTDWAARPLTAEQLRYAADDVAYLPGIYRQLQDNLAAKGRLAWLADEQCELLDPASYDLQPEQAYKKVRHYAQLYPRQLSVLKAVAAERERQAQQLNLPRKWIINDDQLLAIARKMPESVDDLSRIRGVRNKLKRQAAERFVAEVQAAKQLPVPPRAKRQAPSAPNLDKSVYNLMLVILQVVAERAQVAAEVLAHHSDLVHLFVAPDEPNPLLQGWRYDLLGRHLLSLLAGQLTISISDKRIVINDKAAK